jgi:hypothetical protein
MVPLLFGRIQTRIFVLWTVGAVWTLLISFVLPGVKTAPGVDTIERVTELYKITFLVLLIVTVLGVVLWEPLYHALQQFRWEKDWPAMFGLLEGIPEGILAYIVLRIIDPTLDGVGINNWTFFVDFATTWIVTWLWVNTAMRVLTIRWRFRGGRLF